MERLLSWIFGVFGADRAFVAIPALKELRSRYKDRDVEFLGVHTAGTEMALVKRLLKQQDWDLMVREWIPVTTSLPAKRSDALQFKGIPA